MSTKNPIYLTIHGHFYQPPRENPWTDEIEIQDSALPDHDWNDRIASQCYDANSASRLLNPHGKIEKIVNNYEYMSFNFGPTLMSWIRDKRPDTYQRIIEGDQKSSKRLNGHGNAIAQVYNHIIMPLASDADRKAQIEWGIRDFEFHFGRKPEGMWLAETAINTATVVDLINAGIKYTILAPTQAQGIKEFDSDKWLDVSHSNIDTTRPYRIFPRDEDGDPLVEDGYLDVFFYDGNLSSAVGFEHLLRDAQTYINKIKGAYNSENPNNQLISIATDGESYGHHEPFGDMCASYMFNSACPKENIIPVNFGYYLEQFPPAAEVTLKNDLGEGTAWSCAHGVGRWYRNCGCTTGSPSEWNQEWRGPVRHAYNYLSKHTHRVFEREVVKLSNTPPENLLHDYVSVLLNKSFNYTQEFLEKHLGSSENLEAKGSQLLKLLEMQKFAMFTFTSCGWFFGELSGLEPVQNMKYARKTIELLTQFESSFDLDKFLSFLDEAKSNIDDRTAKQLYHDYTSSPVPTTMKVIGEVLYRQLHTHCHFCSQTGHFSLTINKIDSTAIKIDNIEIFNRSTWEREHHTVACFKNQHNDSYFIFIPQGSDISPIKAFDNPNHEPEEILSLYPQAVTVTFSDLFDDAFITITSEIIQKSSRSILEDYKVFPAKHGMIMEMLQQNQKPLDESIALPLRMSINAHLYEMLEQALVEVTPALIIEIDNLNKRAKHLRFRLTAEWIEERYNSSVLELISIIRDNPDKEKIEHVTHLITLADTFGMNIHKVELENIIYPMYEMSFKQYRETDEMPEELIHLFSWLNFYLPDEIYSKHPKHKAKPKHLKV